MERKSVKKPVRELKPIEKFVRWVLLSFAPSTGKMSTNDLFNKGYGNIVTISCQLCFFAVFMYYAITNSIYNRTAQFLIPKDGDSGGGTCENVALEINNDFMIDSNGLWNSDPTFKFGSVIHDLTMANSKFEGGSDDYREMIDFFAEDLKNRSSACATNDYAANMAFGGSYVAFNYEFGLSAFDINADARVMYDQTVLSGGFVNSTSACVPANTAFTFTDGHFTMTTTRIISTEEHVWDPCDGMFDSVANLGYNSEKNAKTVTMFVDSATMVIANSINHNYEPLDALSVVDSQKYGVLSAYVDSYYSPMQPIFCFDITEFVSDHVGEEAVEGGDLTVSQARMLSAGRGILELDGGLNHVCLVEFGNTLAYPFTTSYGSVTSDCWLPSECTCEMSDPSGLCSEYNIDVAFLFMKHTEYSGVTDDEESQYNAESLLATVMTTRLVALQNSTSVASILRPALAVGVEAHFWMSLGHNFSSLNSAETFSYVTDPSPTCPSSAESALSAGFEVIPYCDNCVILEFQLSDALQKGVVMNAGHLTRNDMSCNNPYYNQTVFDIISATVPTSLEQKYQVCTNNLQTAISTGISNAFASAGLYTSILAAVLMFFLMRYHKKFRPDEEIFSPEEQEIIVRNSTAYVFEAIIAKMKLDPKEKKEMLGHVANIFISDPAEHIELFDDGRAKGIKVDTVIESIKHDFEHIDKLLSRMPKNSPHSIRFTEEQRRQWEMFKQNLMAEEGEDGMELDTFGNSGYTTLENDKTELNSDNKDNTSTEELEPEEVWDGAWDHIIDDSVRNHSKDGSWCTDLV